MLSRKPGHPADSGGWLLISPAGLRLHPGGFLARRGGRGTPPTDSAASDTEDSGPEQAVYPNVLNERIQRGGNGNPAVSLYYPCCIRPPWTRPSAAGRDVADACEKEVSKADGPDEKSPAATACGISPACLSFRARRKTWSA